MSGNTVLEYYVDKCADLQGQLKAMTADRDAALKCANAGPQHVPHPAFGDYMSTDGSQYKEIERVAELEEQLKAVTAERDGFKKGYHLALAGNANIADASFDDDHSVTLAMDDLRVVLPQLAETYGEASLSVPVEMDNGDMMTLTVSVTE